MQNKNIFIEIPTWLGDAVMATPAIENIVKKFPSCKLTIFGSFVSTRLFLNHPNVQNIIIDDSKSKGNRYINLYKLAKKVGQVDLAFSFRKNITTKILLFFINAKEKYIYARYTKDEIHQVIRYNDFINKSIDISTFPANLKIYLNKTEEIKTKPTLGINPGATYGSAKRWYPKEFAKIAIELQNKYDIIIFGGPAEKDIALDIQKELDINGVTNYKNLAGLTTIPELLESISTLDLFITGDSGPMHVAAAFNIPTISIFGPTKHIETSQWNNDNSKILRKEFDCAPCMKRECPLKDERNHQCMKSITANDVLYMLSNSNK
ncbi:MAG TPA: glycosyltransferase family 9 protein [Arcobacter sp.]|nr:glycosyltransferase family 9 protein [Arcobacter sp.]